MVLRDTPEIGRAAERGIAYDCVSKADGGDGIRAYFDKLADFLEDRMNK
jgi:hypothetical protein